MLPIPYMQIKDPGSRKALSPHDQKEGLLGKGSWRGGYGNDRELKKEGYGDNMSKRKLMQNEKYITGTAGRATSDTSQ